MESHHPRWLTQANMDLEDATSTLETYRARPDSIASKPVCSAHLGHCSTYFKVNQGLYYMQT